MSDTTPSPEPRAPAVISARGIVKRYGSTIALSGFDVDIGRGITGLLGSNGAGKTTFISLVLGLRRRDDGALSVLGEDPTTAGIPSTRANRLLARAPRPARGAHRRRLRPPPRGDAPPPHARRRPAGERRALAGRARRGAVPSRRHDVDGTAPAGQAGRRDRARSGARPARRADRRARPGAAHRDARAHPPHRNRVRDGHPRLVAPPRGGGADLRRGGHRRGRRRGALGDARRPPGRAGRRHRRRGGRAGRGARGAARASAASRSRCTTARSSSPEAEDVHDQVRDAVADLGIGLRRLAPRGRTLEDVYLGAGT